MNPPNSQFGTSNSHIITSHNENFTANNEVHNKILRVSHETIYRYDYPVNFSKHYLRLHPVRDQQQSLLEHEICVSSAGHTELFEDVFGNRTIFFQIEQSFSELIVSMKAMVRVPSAKTNYHTKIHPQTIPLSWLPWQRQMMLPYLLPPKLPEVQLSALTDYALSFIKRNDYMVMNILNDLNTTIYNEYTFVSGLTDLSTTPFEVYQHRKGVCQDFTNLFICLARLLNIPARYRSGYVFTGHDHENKVISEASHAWVEVYLPWQGWVGYDPTNGYLTSSDHIRIACGRNYSDAAPISGTIFASGGNRETMEINVKVEECL